MAHRATLSLTLLALAGVTLPAVEVSATTLAGGARAGGTFTVVDSLGGITGPGGTAGNLTVSLGQAPRIFLKSRPKVFNSRHSVAAGSVLTQTVVATDGDNDPISLSVVTQPKLGVLSFAANGQFTYTANADVGGVDTFTVQGFDGVATSDTATITVTIAANQSLTRALIPGLEAPYQNLKAGTPVTVAVIGGKPPYTFTTTNGSAKPIAPFRFLDVDGDGQLDTGAIGQLIPQASSSAISPCILTRVRPSSCRARGSS